MSKPIPKISRSDNHLFTLHYQQPDSYHFCQDSVIFPLFLRQHLATLEIGHDFRALDICAGCGIVGLEVAYYEPRLTFIDFIEVQGIFRESFTENRDRLDPDRRRALNFIEMNYAAIPNGDFANRYDLIFGNPPYFMPTEGALSDNPVQNRCRFFLDSDFRALLTSVHHALKPTTGKAFLLIKSGAEHGRNALLTCQLELAGQASVKAVAELRGTLIIEISNKADA